MKMQHGSARTRLSALVLALASILAENSQAAANKAARARNDALDVGTLMAEDTSPQGDPKNTTTGAPNPNKGAVFPSQSVISTTLASSTPFELRPVEIVLESASSPEITPEAEDAWTAACNELGKTLQPGTGPYGFGIASGHSCRRAEPVHERASDSWLLEIKTSALPLRIALFMPYELVTPAAVVTVSDTDASHLLAALAQHDIAALLILAMLDRLPALSSLSPDNSDSSTGIIKTKTDVSAKERFSLPDPPQTLVIYSLARQGSQGSSIYLPMIVTKANLTKDDTTSTPEWKAATPFTPPADQTLWLHNEGGPGLIAEDAETSFLRAVTEFSDDSAVTKTTRALVDSISTGFVGLRYGHSISKGSLMERASFFGMLAELRGGPAAGLRLYVENWPEVKWQKEGVDESFSCSRYTFGWAFNFDIESLASRFYLVPRIGAWSIKTHAANSEVGTVNYDATFSTKSALSLGSDAGYELSTPFLLFRAWAAADIGGLSVLKNPDRTTVRSTRFGFDTLTNPKGFNVFGKNSKIALLGFIFNELVEIEKSTPKIPRVISIGRVSYRTTYVGGGAAFSW